MNTHFSPTRLWHALRWLCAYESRKMLTLFLMATATFAFVNTLLLYKEVQVYQASTLTFDVIMQLLILVCGISLVLLSIMMCGSATFAFTTLHRRHAGRQLLMLPASNLEKYTALWLLYVPLLFVLFLAAFVVADVLRQLILPLLTAQGNLPSAVPIFARNLLTGLTAGMRTESLQALLFACSFVLAIHAFSLLAGTLAGYGGWLLTALATYGWLRLFLSFHQSTGLFSGLSFASAIIFLLLSYRLFCRFPLFPSLQLIRFHGI